MFPNFHGINTPTVVGGKLPSRCQQRRAGRRRTQPALRSRCECRAARHGLGGSEQKEACRFEVHSCQYKALHPHLILLFIFILLRNKSRVCFVHFLHWKSSSMETLLRHSPSPPRTCNQPLHRVFPSRRSYTGPASPFASGCRHLT